MSHAYKIEKTAEGWRIVREWGRYSIPLPFLYQSKDEAQHELDRAKKVAR